MLIGLDSTLTSIHSYRDVLPHLHRPHFNHGPLGRADLLADMWLRMPVTLYLQVEYSIHGLIIRSLCFLWAPCNIAAVLANHPETLKSATLLARRAGTLKSAALLATRSRKPTPCSVAAVLARRPETWLTCRGSILSSDLHVLAAVVISRCCHVELSSSPAIAVASSIDLGEH